MKNQDRRFQDVLVINNETKRMKVVKCRRGHIQHLRYAYRFSTVCEMNAKVMKAVEKLLGRDGMALETYDKVK